MKHTFNGNQKIGEIATIFPRTKDIFLEFHIDFCCGGDRELGTVLKEQGINEVEILERLNHVYLKNMNSLDESTDWSIAPLTDLIDYIVEKHHTFMWRELPLIEGLLSKILKVHYVDHGEVLSKLNKLFNALKTELEEHLIKEEQVLFPLIQTAGNNLSSGTFKEIFEVMNETEDEHDKAGELLKEMRRLTDGFIVPTGECSSFARAYEKLRAMELDLFDHIHLENNILFERLKSKA